MRAIHLALPVAILLSIGSSWVLAQAKDAPSWAGEVDARITQAMERDSIPGVQLAIAENGRLIYSKSYGLADMETGRKVTNNTLFHVGSVTKSFTGLLLAELAAQGKVELEAPISRYVPELKGPVARATTHQLLTHSAGWGDATTYSGRSDDAALGESMLSASDAWIHTSPKRIFSYSNPGFSMAGYVAERAAGKPFAQLMDEGLLDKLSLDHATFRPAFAMTRDFSLGHVRDGQGKTVVQRPMPVNAADNPGGFLYSTAEDLVRFCTVLMQDGMLDGERVVSERAVRLATSRNIAIPGTPDNRSGYGLQIDVVGGERVWRKSGAISGFVSQISMWPDRKLAVAINVNNQSEMPMSHTAIVAQIAKQVAAAPAPAAKVERVGTPGERRQFVGRYRAPDGAVVEIVEADGALQFRGKRGPFPVFLVGEDRIVVKRPDRSVESIVLRDPQGNVEFLHAQSRAVAKLP